MKVIKIHPNDNVAVAIEAINAQEEFEVNGQSYVATMPIPAGHKVAIQTIAVGENVIKYGFPIGHAKVEIQVGEHVHSHNVIQYTYT